MKFLWVLAQVQSIRLDEAQVWDALADSIGDMEVTVVKTPEAAPDAAVGSKRMFPPPLSRHS